MKEEIKKYSVSLVYQDQATIMLRVLICNANSEEEAIGKAVREFEGETKGYGLTMKVIIPIDFSSYISKERVMEIVEIVFYEEDMSLNKVKEMLKKEYGL